MGRALALCGVLGGVWGCDDRLPTLAPGEDFPEGIIPPTLEHFLETEEFLLSAQAFTGPTGLKDPPFLLVARDFDGVLNAHALFDFVDFPDTVIVNGVTYEEFSYVDGQVLGVMADTLAASASSLLFSLWTITQPFDTATVSWDFAIDRPGEQVPWTTPGGTLGTLLDQAIWAQADTGAVGDSLKWNISGEAITRLRTGETAGLLVELANAGTRAQILPISIRANIVINDLPDTTVVRTIRSGFPTFAFTPAIPQPPDVLRASGITSDRSLLLLGLDVSLPGCAQPETCPAVGPDEVSLNRVELILDPVPVTDGFRPVGPTIISAWRVVEPELGPRAPLASLADTTLVEDVLFLPGGGAPVAFDITGTYAAAVAGEDDQLGIALLVEPEASIFGYTWFTKNPRLRFVYTSRPSPELP